MSGAAIADAAGLGTMEIEAMVDEDYDPGFAAAITAASSVIGPIIPPSIPMVLFAVISGASVGRLFLAGFIPGLLMAVALMIITYFIGRRRGYRTLERASLKTMATRFGEAFWALLTPLVIMGGILSGVFTPTEAAVVTVAYALTISGFVYRSLRLKDVIEAFVSTVEFTANIIIVIAAANLFGWVLTRQNVPQALTAGLLTISTNPTVLLAVIATMVLVLGCFMEGNSIMLILVPMLMPVAASVGIDLVHLGVVFVLAQMIGLVTPPFAVIINVVANIAHVSFSRTLREIWPFLIALVVVAIATVLSEDLILFLPRLLMR